MKELLESRQIRAFVAVARRGNFTQGAKDVFLTQSAVSHAIKSLEEDVGCALFQRVGRRAVLTSAGERLLQHCEEILHKMQDARMDLSQMPDITRPTLRIGAPMTICQHLLPAALREVQQEFPQCEIRVETGDNPQLLAQLLSGKIDLAVMVEPEKRPHLVFVPLFRDELRFVMLPGHPWAQAGEISAQELREATIILPNKTTRTYQLVMGYFRAARISLKRLIELGSIESIRELVKNGLGVGVVANWPIRAEIERGELVSRPLGGTPLTREWYAVHLRDHELRATESSVLHHFRATVASIDLGPGAAASGSERSARTAPGMTKAAGAGSTRERLAPKLSALRPSLAGGK